jgi:hypothetical protein
MKTNFDQDCEPIKQLKKIREKLCDLFLIKKTIYELKEENGIIGNIEYYFDNVKVFVESMNEYLQEIENNTFIKINPKIKDYYDDKGSIVWGSDYDAYIFGILYKFNVNIYQVSNTDISEKVYKDRTTFNTGTYDQIENFNQLPTLRNTVSMKINKSDLVLIKKFNLKDNYRTIDLLMLEQHWMILLPNPQYHITGGIHHIFNFGLIGLLIICIIWLIIIIYKQILYNRRRYNLRILYKK